MNTTLKVGLIFQAIQFGLIGTAGLVWLLTKLQITEIGIIIFMWVCLNIASLVLIINGTMKETKKENPREYLR